MTIKNIHIRSTIVLVVSLLATLRQHNLSSKIKDFFPSHNEETVIQNNSNTSIDDVTSPKTYSNAQIINNPIEELPETSGISDISNPIKLENENFELWKSFMEPWKIFSDSEVVLLNFVNADLINVLKYIESVYKVVFITDDSIQPTTPGGRSLVGSKVNFTSQTPFSYKEAWSIFVTLLESAGVTLQPGSMQRTYRVTTLAKDSPLSYVKGILPTYIGVDSNDLPESDMRIRYIYLAKHSSLRSLENLIKTMQSPNSPEPIQIPEIFGLLITDRVYNIKTILSVIQSIDQLTSPETVSVIKLTKTDVLKITELLKALIREEAGPNQQASPRMLGPKRTDILSYFDSSIRLVPDIRTNSIIAIGALEAVSKVEHFIKEYERNQNRLSHAPTFVYYLKYTQAEAVARILKQAVDFRPISDPQSAGSVRNGDKIFSNVNIVAENSSNSIIITATEDEYWHIYNVLQKLDVEQPQVGLDIMMVSVSLNDIKALGTQLRNAQDVLGGNINMQSAHLSGTVVNDSSSSKSNIDRILGNLLELVSSKAVGTEAGSTLVSLGSDEHGAWGLLRILQQHTNTYIWSNPYLVATNKYESSFSSGEERRIPTNVILNDAKENQTFSTDSARISVKITPQINIEDQLVKLGIQVENSQFTEASGVNIESGNKQTHSINTSISAVNNATIILGGLITEKFIETEVKTPILGDIPLIGWLFKNKKKNKDRSLLLIFITPKIMTKDTPEVIQNFNDKALKQRQDAKSTSKQKSNDPVNLSYFDESNPNKVFDNFLQNDRTTSNQVLNTNSKELTRIGTKNRNRKKRLKPAGG